MNQFSPISFSVRRSALCALSLAALSISGGAFAADPVYPARPVTLVVPFPPGGSSDVIARALAPKLGERLGTTIIVDNRPGAGTAIGAGYVAKAAPDGYTLLLGSGSTLTLNPAIRKTLPYDSVKSFEPVGMVSRAGLVLLANPGAPVKNLEELKTAVKGAPNKYAYASFGAGTSSHFAAEMGFYAMGIKLTHVPYKGSAPAMTDLIGGQVPFSFDTVTAALPQLKAGKIKAIAIASPKRVAALPDVPTFAESGYADVKLESWSMLMTPRGVPAPVKAKLQKALADTLSDAGVRKALSDQGLEPSYSTAADAAALIENELPLMRATAARANIQAD
ncbi:MAG TPA: tripartite tricarboxylate transporter substrate binding protein [Burkholderiaceae bacterium]|nr:tripartite tricarboxylate transporter substrate binding protein [Burkholderiaceae bacterium]